MEADPMSSRYVADHSTLEFLLVAGWELTACVLEDDFGFYWLSPDAVRSQLTHSLEDLPQEVCDWLDDVMDKPKFDGSDIILDDEDENAI